MAEAPELENPRPFLHSLSIPCSLQAPSIPLRRADLGGVQFAVVQLEDLQGSLEVGLGLQQFQLDGPQTVNAGGRQVHPEQGQIHLSHTGTGTQVRLAAPPRTPSKRDGLQ